MSKTGVIIVAGGTGTRMGSEIPKQFLRVRGKEVLVYTLEKFLGALAGAGIVIVLPQEYFHLWESIADKHGLRGTHRVCAGGENRFMSVKNGLAVLGPCDIIAIHDGVRPLLSEEMIKKCFDIAAAEGTAIPVVEPADSFRMLSDGYPEIISRANLRAVQTPQVFREDIIRKAYETEYLPRFTDDASVVEHSGVRLVFCEGEYRNVKITRPEDMLFAEAVISSPL